MTDAVYKSAFGRKSLFVEDPNVLLRSIRSCASVSRRKDGAVYHRLRTLDPSARVACWHCCEWIEGERFPLPKAYDASLQKYYVYGAFCSPRCAKAHVIEHTSFDRGHQMNLFVRMMREVYGVTCPVQEAPPRISLQRFGGPFDAADFGRTDVRCAVVEPPFLSYCMLVEEQAIGQGLSEAVSGPLEVHSEEDDLLEEPAQEGRYDSFLRDNPSVPPPAAAPPKPARQKEKRPRQPGGGGGGGTATVHPPPAGSSTLHQFAKRSKG